MSVFFSIYFLCIIMIFLFIWGCYVLFNTDAEHSLLEPSEWYDDYGTKWKITKRPYGYIIEYCTVGNLWHHWEEYEYKNGHIVEIISHFDNYDEAKNYLFEHHKKYKNSLYYEHL